MSEELLSPEKPPYSAALEEAKRRHDEVSLWRYEQREALVLQPQVVVFEEKPEAGKLSGPTDDLFYKPTGGLWTSTLNDEGGEWLRWLHGEGYSLDMPRWGGKLWRLQPIAARVYVVSSPLQLYELLMRFPHPRGGTRMLVDWVKVAEEYDAIHVPNPWPWRWGTDLTASMFFYSMDAESTCWFRWCFDGEPVELDPKPFLERLSREEE